MAASQKVTRKRIRHATFRSVRDLIKAINDYVRQYNMHPQPLQWVASTSKIIQHGCCGSRQNRSRATEEIGFAAGNTASR